MIVRTLCRLQLIWIVLQVALTVITCQSMLNPGRSMWLLQIALGLEEQTAVFALRDTITRLSHEDSGVKYVQYCNI